MKHAPAMSCSPIARLFVGWALATALLAAFAAGVAQGRQGVMDDLTPGATGPKAKVELLVADTTVRPGQTLMVGVKFTLEPGWHIYWHNPGDSGEPPTFNWNLPGGGAARMLRGGEWTATEPQFPTPHRFEAGGLVGFGYEKEVIFPAELTVPASATPGQSAEVTVTTGYLICADVCIPETATASVRLEVSTAPEHDAAATEAIAAAKRSLPVPAASMPAVKVASTQTRPDGTREMTVAFGRAVDHVEFFPDPPRGVAVEDIAVESDGTSATVRFRTRAMTGARVTEPSFPAVVGYTTDGVRQGVRVDVPVGDGADE